MIDCDALKKLTEEDLRHLIKPIGLLAKFREKWISWKEDQFEHQDALQNLLSTVFFYYFFLLVTRYKNQQSTNTLISYTVSKYQQIKKITIFWKKHHLQHLL
jgi:siroheme synthase (precorrin-2 oxidase/ferrochelatase)